MIAKEGKGDMLKDADGHSFVDYCMSWGALLHGHAPDAVVNEAVKRVQSGSSFGIATEEEEKLARQICTLIPSIEKVRFVSSGTEATMSAIRLARGVTGRSLIVKFNGNYHGHADPFLVCAGSGVSQVSQTSSSEGVLPSSIEHTVSLPYNDINAAKELFEAHEVAAVIVEPIAANMGVAKADPAFLQFLRDETKRTGALLIFDEVISGFRVGLQGSQGKYGIQPDLTCFGKIVGGGFPAAAFGGKKEIMDHLAPNGTVYQAGTLSGNPVAMAAGLKTLELAMKEGFYEDLEAKTRLITEPVKMALKERHLSACLNESVGMFTLFWGPSEVRSFEDLKQLDHALFKRFFNTLYDQGIYVSPSPYEACFISSAHTEENLIKTRDALMGFIRTL